jgi:hypothetical protein
VLIVKTVLWKLLHHLYSCNSLYSSFLIAVFSVHTFMWSQGEACAASMTSSAMAPSLILGPNFNSSFLPRFRGLITETTYPFDLPFVVRGRGPLLFLYDVERTKVYIFESNPAMAGFTRLIETQGSNGRRVSMLLYHPTLTECQ